MVDTKQIKIVLLFGLIKRIVKQINNISPLKITYLNSLRVWVNAISGLLNFIFKKIKLIVKPEKRLIIIDFLPALICSKEVALLLINWLYISIDQSVAIELNVESTVLISEANNPHKIIPLRPTGI